VRTTYAEADGVALPEPDPANEQRNTYSWMTVHTFTPDRPVTYPFKDFKSLEPTNPTSSPKTGTGQSDGR
jgi:hypothetical protein